MKRIIYTRPDGGVSIVSPAAEQRLLTETEEEFMVRIQTLVVPSDAINPQIVDESVIPTDRTFRNALRQTGSALTHDMPKCRDIWRNKLRELRRPKMAALDAAYMQADERGDTVEKARIAVEKQALRDVTADPRIEAAQTPNELKAVMPPELL